MRGVRGRGLLWGIELHETSAAGGGAAWARRALGAGVLALPAGAQGEVLELLPPAVLTLRQLAVALAGLRRTAPVATAPGRSSAGAIR